MWKERKIARTQKTLAGKTHTFYSAINLLTSGSPRQSRPIARGGKKGEVRRGGKREAKRTFGVLARRGARNVYRQWHLGKKAYIICISWNNKYYLILYRSMLLIHFRVRRAKSPAHLRTSPWEKLEIPSETHALFSIFPPRAPIFNLWNYFHRRDRWLSIHFCTS